MSGQTKLARALRFNDIITYMQEENTPIKSENEEKPTLDVFHWANQTDAIKNDLTPELFLFNKNYTPYKIRFSDDLSAQIRSLFLYDVINFINSGAGTGLSVRDYELSDGEEDVIYRTELDKVGRAETLIHLIEHEYQDIIYFSEKEHDFKRIKGILARFTYENKSFYVVKQIMQTQALKGPLSWELNSETLEPFKADIGLKVPADNQVAIIDKEIVIFNQGKFEKLFNYDYKSQVIAEKKAAEISEIYKLSFPEGINLNNLLQDKKALIKKIQSIEPGEVTQEQAITYADDMGLDLMTDNDGSILIMDSHDLNTFVNLLNEDYITSQVTGKRYVVIRKKLLDEPAAEAPRG